MLDDSILIYLHAKKKSYDIFYKEILAEKVVLFN